MGRIRRNGLGILLWTCWVGLLLSITLVTPARSQELRALWVTRWDYRSPEHVKLIIRNAAEFNFNTILFQVRGNGTVLYASELEPWAEELGGKDPGWDPLQTAIDEAHAHGLKLHAWINVFPGWRGHIPPDDPQQLWNKHPDWFMVDPDGRSQPLNNHYSWLSPTHPEVQSHLRKIFLEVLEHYDIDGIHLDYFRYPGPGYSYDPVSVAHFKQQTGSTPDDAPYVWDEWRRQAVSRLLGVLYSAVKSHRPEVVVSSAVVGDYRNAQRLFFQDSHKWLAMGIIDVIFPMIYTPDSTLFRRLATEHLEDTKSRFICPGINVGYDYSWIEQIQIARQEGSLGFSLFSYENLFPNHRPSSAMTLSRSTILSENATVPPMRWKTTSRDLDGPVISDFRTIPSPVRNSQPFRVLCRITDPSGVYDDDTGSGGQGIYLVWSYPEQRSATNEILMASVKDAEGWYVTAEKIPGQDAASEMQLRVFARDNSDNRNLGYSDITSVVVGFSRDLYYSAGEFGPLIWNASSIAVDSTGQIWVTSREDQCIHVLTREGAETPFSPITFGLSPAADTVDLENPTTVAVNTKGIIHVGTGGSQPMVFRYSSNGRFFRGVQLDISLGDLDFDQQDHAFVQQAGATNWHVFDPNWSELKGSPFGDGLVGNGLAVSPDGQEVYLASESEGTVQRWVGAIEGEYARFWHSGSLPLSNIGKGKVDTDNRGNIYASHMPVGRVTILDAKARMIGFLRGGSPPIRAPKNVSLCPTGREIYVLETGAVGPSRLSKWVRTGVMAEEEGPH